MSKNINDFLDDSGTSGNNNEATVLKSKLMSIVASEEVKKEENDNIKEICKDLKDQHGISSKTAKRVAKILANPELLKDYEDDNAAVDLLYSKVTRSNKKN